jgi:hypothetical protein
MEVNEDLYESIKSSNGEQALYLTGQLLIDNIESLQITWIKLTAQLGEYCNLQFSKWYETVTNISEFIQSEEVLVQTAFVISTKLCILFKNAYHYISVPKKTLAILRTLVLDVFETNHIPNPNLKEVFLLALPKPKNEQEFCLKIISGLLNIWNERKAIRTRECLEYLCRKEYTVENEFMEFLWGFFKLFQPKISTDAYVLYKAFYRKKDKNWRYGLLYGLHNYINDKDEYWTVNELHVIQEVIKMTPDMWASFNHKPPEKETKLDKMELFQHYYPTRMNLPEEENKNLKEEVKKISVKR